MTEGPDSLMPFLQAAALVGVAALSLLALRSCLRFPHFRTREKIIHSLVILALPILGPVIFFRTRESIESSVRRQAERRRRFGKR